jgi:hypothetical protein
VRPEDRYLRFVRWEEVDGLYVGYCPDLFPWGGVCHASTEEDAYSQLRVLVTEEVQRLQRAGEDLPPSRTRAMREAISA